MSNSRIFPDGPSDFPSMPSMPTLRAGGDANALGRIDHYDLLRKLGGGGFGVVYLALDTASGMEVALKTLHPLLKSNAEEMDMLREKFRLVSRLSHPNIATALVLHPCQRVDIWDETARREMCLSSGESVMVMRYAPGTTLSKWRRQFPGGVVPLDLALDIARQIASALDYAHGEHIVHRDIKPANIMVETLEDNAQCTMLNAQCDAHGGASSPSEPDNQTKLRVRLLDFGLAAEIRSSMSRVSTEQGDTSGTRPYMAPEQWLGKKQDGRTDQYALACVLYEMLSGASPFAGVFETGDPAIMKDAVVHDAPEEIGNVPAHVNAALLRALAKDPAARFPSCGAFVDALGRLARSARPTLGRRIWPWVAALGLLAAGTLVVTEKYGKNGEGGASSPSEPPRGDVSHAESAEVVATAPSPSESRAESAKPGGASSPSEPPAVAPQRNSETPETRKPGNPPLSGSPGSLAQPSLPPEGASLDELKSSRGRFAAALDARRAENWPDDTADSATLVSAISELDNRIAAALKEREEQEKRAEHESVAKRTADARAVAEMGRLKAAAIREIMGLDAYRKWNDGEFKTQFETLDRQKAVLDGLTKAADFGKAKEAAADIHSAAVWIADNAEAREGLDAMEKSIDALSPDLEKAEAKRYAQSSLYKSETARNEAVRRRDRSDFTGAKKKFEEAKRHAETALAEARRTQASTKAREAVGEAEAAKIREDWETVLAKANAALALDAGNSDAKSLKAEAEAKLAAIRAEKDRLAREEEAKRKRDEAARPESSPHRAGERKVIHVGSQEIALRWCPPGTFMMGSPASEDGCYDNETQHRVTLSKGFWMGETEVTQGFWKEVVGNNPSHFKSGDDYPVENISWNDSQEFLAALNRKSPVSGFRWTLPTEAQWEYACRAGSTTAYFWGNALNGDRANCDGNHPCGTTQKGPYKQKTTPVGSYTANAWGLHDMHGNVWEWCSDWYGTYPTGAVRDPAGPSTGSNRVCRGGSWVSNARLCRSAYRSNIHPGDRFNNLGFRVALAPVQ